MNPWDKVEEILLSHVVTIMSDAERGESWLNALKGTGENGVLFGVSLAIDILNETIDVADLARFFTEHNPGDPNHAIDLLDSSEEIAAIRDREPGVPYDHGGYVRVVELGGFVDKYLRRPLDSENVEWVRREYLSDPRANRLSEVQNAWSGRKGRVWVLPKREFNEAREAHATNLAAFLNDVLGLGYNRATYAEHPEFIVVYYPEDFEQRFTVKPRQPTCFDACWKPAGFYISYAHEDGWGRTHPCSGSELRHRERVHMKIEALTDDFRLEWLGKACEPKFDHARLTLAAEKRLVEAEVRLRHRG